MILVKRMREIYGGTPLVVVFSAFFAMFELVMMWIVAPKSTHALGTQQESPMFLFIGEDGAIEPSSDVDLIIAETIGVSARLNNSPSSWQRPLLVENPCSLVAKQHSETVEHENPTQPWIDHKLLVELASRAAIELEVTSILRGKKSLANISGSIYQEGDTLLSLRGECSFLIKEVAKESVIIELIIEEDQLRNEYGAIERILFLTGSVSEKMAEAGDDQ
jgi:hypothetical protein